MSRIEKIENQPNKELSPRFKKDLVTIGDVLFRNGEKDEAETFWRKAELTPEDIEAIKQNILAEREGEVRNKAKLQEEDNEMIGKIYREMAAKAREEGDEDKAKIYELAIKHIGKEK